MKKILTLFIAVILSFLAMAQKTFVVTQYAPSAFNENSFEETISGGDTVFIESSRTQGLVFMNINGSENSPVVVTNGNGQVKINDPDIEAAIEFRNCTNIKFVGKGTPENQYGFELSAHNSGISITERSSNVEISNVKIDHDGFFGIVVKKDYNGNPPSPVPVFEKLVIHDCLVQNVAEGMYLGETVTPGMEFKHVKIYNNIVVNTGREGIQIANMVEDIEVFNNIIMNSGLDGLDKQGSNFQVGDNSIGHFHHNVFMNANKHGTIVLGAGDIIISENYYENNSGIFVDNRMVTIPHSTIDINKNYFRDIADDVVIKLENELNQINLTDNIWYGSNNFSFTDVSNQNIRLTLTNNNYSIFLPISINDYKITEQNSADFLLLGPQKDLTHQFNYKPLIEEIKDQIFNTGTKNLIEIKASTPDSDNVSFMLVDTLDFIVLTDLDNGAAEIEVSPGELDEGEYILTVVAWDHSHKHKSRQTFTITISKNITGILETKLNDVIVYPNPVNESFSIKNNGKRLSKIELVTLSGKIVQCFNVENQFEYSHFILNRNIIKPGIYILNVHTRNNTKEVIKLRVD